MPMRGVQIVETECRTILNRCTMGFAEYTLNAYQGCPFACSYCYVPVMRERRGQVDSLPWGQWVQVKTNAPDVLRRQMLNVPPEARIAIGTASDSWQPIEKRYRISRRILEELAYYPNPVQVVTRSPLLLRDLDVLRRIPNVWVGVSIPTFDDSARRAFEPHAPAIPGRVHLVRELVRAGMPVRLFWCPILYGVADSAEAVRDYLATAASLGVKKVFCETLNYSERLFGPHLRLLRAYREQEGIRGHRSLSRSGLSAEIRHWSQRLGVECRL